MIARLVTFDEAGGERLLGEYTFNHIIFPCNVNVERMVREVQRVIVRVGVTPASRSGGGASPSLDAL
jgi:hypothetical protein